MSKIPIKKVKENIKKKISKIKKISRDKNIIQKIFNFRNFVILGILMVILLAMTMFYF
ncbi:MAG: hypothetical protein PHP14_03675 [Candidatus Pacebacteria bacterium]|nr:hypothetical protein [Candidatus Paceibacterota bacterium]MDD3808231.1 hypothetical protein [Candidatus Paceibacterota bacterium]